MKIYGQIHFSIWDDPHFSEFSQEQRWLFVFLFSNKHTRSCESGIYEISLQQIYEGTRIPKKTIIKLLSNPGQTPGKPNGNPPQGLGMGLRNITYDFDNMVCFVRNFRKRQNTGGNPEKIKIAIKNEHNQLKNSPVWNEFFREYPEFLDDETNPLQTPGKPPVNPDQTDCTTITTNDNDNDNVKRKELKKDVNVYEQSKNLKDVVENSANMVKLSFVRYFKGLPYPYRSQEQSRIKLHSQLDTKLCALLARTRGDPEPFINHMEQASKNGKDVGSISYFLDGYQGGASVWDKLCDQLVFDEHSKIKEEFKRAIDENKALKMIATSLVETDHPDYMHKAIAEYKRLVQKYDIQTDMTEKQLLKDQVLTMKKKLGL